jgi:hypothetical protein
MAARRTRVCLSSADTRFRVPRSDAGPCLRRPVRRINLARTIPRQILNRFRYLRWTFFGKIPTQLNHALGCEGEAQNQR